MEQFDVNTLYLKVNYIINTLCEVFHLPEIKIIVVEQFYNKFSSNMFHYDHIKNMFVINESMIRKNQQIDMYFLLITFRKYYQVYLYYNDYKYKEDNKYLIKLFEEMNILMNAKEIDKAISSTIGYVDADGDAFAQVCSDYASLKLNIPSHHGKLKEVYDSRYKKLKGFYKKIDFSFLK